MLVVSQSSQAYCRFESSSSVSAGAGCGRSVLQLGYNQDAILGEWLKMSNFVLPLVLFSSDSVNNHGIFLPPINRIMMFLNTI